VSFGDVLLNPVAQAKFVHTVAAGYVVGSVFVLAISAWYLLKGRNTDIARRSLAVAASFGLACSLCVVVLGDESGYEAGENQKMKVAAIESEWHTQPAPASFTLFGIPDLAARKTHAAVKVPWLLGLIATRSIDRQVPGIFDLVEHVKGRVESGMQAHAALQALRADKTDAAARSAFEAHRADLGYGLLLLRYTSNPATATPEQVERAAWSTVARRRFILELPVHGRTRFVSDRVVRHCVLPGIAPSIWGKSLVSQSRSVQPAVAMGRRRTRMDCGRVRPPALGHRWFVADIPRHIDQIGLHCLVIVARVRCLLHRIGRRRCLLDGARDPSRARWIRLLA
jgi:cytochrome bd-type quinol oxidase subunit 1